MKKTFIYLWLSSIVLFPVLNSCVETDLNTDITSGNNNPSKNLPVTANVPNSFSFVVDASSFDYAETHQVQINADTLSIGLTITNFVSGSGKIIIKDSNGSTIYEKDLNSAIVSGEVLQLTAVPKTIVLDLNKFTGKVVLGLSGK